MPKAQNGKAQPPVVLTPEQQSIWEANQDMFGYYVNDSEKSAPQGMITPGLPMGTPLEMAPASIPNYSNPFAPYRSQLLETPVTSVTPLLGDVDKFNEAYGPLKESDYYANVAQQNIAAPFGTTFDENNAYAPNFDKQSLSIDKQSLQFLGQVPFIASGVFANMGKKREQKEAEDQFRNRFLSDSLYTTIPEGYSGNRGDYTLNYGTGLNFRPDEAVYGQFGKVAQYGGEMKRKIKITGLPSAAYGGTQNASAIDEMYPYNSNVRRAEYSNMLEGPGEGSVQQYAEEVPREIANIEAERGETIVKPSDDGLLNMYKIGGKRHSEGGTPLQAGPGDFIFSDTRDMKIKDPAILESFGMTYKKGGYTPAKISKKFNLNDPNIQKTLNDPKADLIARKTAERMFDNNLSQLGKLALVQEARKGFPQGAPGISMPYMQKVELDPSMFMPDVMTPQDASVQMGRAQKGKEVKASDIPTYDEEIKTVLKTIAPDVILPTDIVEGLQPTRGDVGYGRFDPSSASKNWSWLGKPIDYKNKEEVGKAMEQYNNEMFNRFRNAGYSESDAAKYVKMVGFDPNAKNKPNELDKKAGKYFETRVLFDVPPKKMPAPKKQDPIGSYTQEEIIPSAGRNVPSGYYPQDIINMGQTLSDRLGINKYMPYDVTLPQPALMDPTFYDPSRELAANAEMANLVTQNLGQFAGPQALSSRASQIQGTAARSAADVLGRYNNLNVGVANQFEQANKALINDFNVKRALAKADYYDKSTIANQQYDNTKRAANARFTQQATNAITNKSRTDLMNQLVNNYAVDPLTGKIIFTGGSGLTGQNTTPDLAAQYAAMQAEFEKLPGFKDLSAKEKFDIISKNMPRQSSITRKDDLANLIMRALTGNQ